MKTLFAILFLTMLTGLLFPRLRRAVRALLDLACLFLLTRWSNWQERRLDRRGRLFCNIAEGVHEGGYITKTVDAVFATRFLIVKNSTVTPGSNVQLCAASTDYPLGICYDDNVAIGDPANIALFGGNNSTLKVQAGGVLTYLCYLTTNSSGQAIVATTGQNQYVFGMCIAPNGAVSGDVVEFVPILPTKVF